MTIATENGSANLWLKRHLVVPSAIVANDLEPFSSIVTFSGLFGTTFCTPLRRHHVPLVKDFLLLFGEKERLFTLNASGLDVRHGVLS